LSTLPKLTFPVPKAVIWQAEQLYAELATKPDHVESMEVLNRLTSDPLMERVWDELYRKSQKSTESTEFFHPAVATRESEAARNRRLASELREKGGTVNERDAKLLEAEATLLEALGDQPSEWCEQDRAAQIFFYQAFWSAIDIKPVFFQDLKIKVDKLRATAKRLKEEAATLRSLGMKREARLLREVGRDCENEASNILPKRRGGTPSDAGIFSPQPDDPWIIYRQKKDDELRTFVVDLAITTITLFKGTLDGTLANVANVVFGRRDVTRRRVREFLRKGFNKRPKV
jgi:hypothetical protein